MTEEQEEYPEDYNSDLDPGLSGHQQWTDEQLIDAINSPERKKEAEAFQRENKRYRHSLSATDAEDLIVKLMEKWQWIGASNEISAADRELVVKMGQAISGNRAEKPIGKRETVLKYLGFATTLEVMQEKHNGEPGSKLGVYNRIRKMTPISKKTVDRIVKDIHKEVEKWGDPIDGETESSYRLSSRSLVKHWGLIDSKKGRKPGSKNVRQN